MNADSTTHYRLGYRADIEGLRAIAILLVVACHAKVPWLAGGFVGVDVFFVLSGYLISGLLVQEIQTTGELGFANFYLRRLRRLLPALLLMLAVVSVLGRLLLAASAQPEQASAASAAALWLSNFHFAFWNFGYFTPSAETNLYLHTWSLGVEEQFYLVWPLLAVLAMGAWRGARHAPSAMRLKWCFGLVLIASLVLSLSWTNSAPNLAFYMMPARAWQFALGALTFMLVGSPAFRPDSPVSKRHWKVAAGWLGLALIVLAAVLIDDTVPYPGIWALLPSFGTALILASGAKGNASGVGLLLSLRPMQAIGRLSYAWYLWHWPVLLLGAAVLGSSNPWVRLTLVLASLLVAALSYHFVETPIRHNRKLLARPRISVFAALAIMILAGSFGLRWQHAAEMRMQSPSQLPYVKAHDDTPEIYTMGCDDWYHSARVNACLFGDKHARHTAIAMGDSVALQWFPAYKRIFTRPGWRLLVLTKSSCPMVDEPIFYPRIGRIYKNCSRWRKEAMEDVAALNPDVVVLGSTYTYDYTQAQWTQGTRRVLRALAAHAEQVYVMRSTPKLPFDGPSCIAPRSSLYDALSNKQACSSSAHSQHSDDVYHWLQTSARPFDNVQTVDATDLICPNGICHAALGGQIVFRDDQHMTAGFAASLAPTLAKAFGLRQPTHLANRKVH